MMTDTATLRNPEEWKGLTATGTRYGLLVDLYEIVHWDESLTFTKEGMRSLSDYWDFFCEDFMFKDNPESMVGQSLFEDELPYVQRFIEVFVSYADVVPEELFTTPRNRTEISLPPIIIERAKELYEKLVEKGDPKVEQYLK